MSLRVSPAATLGGVVVGIDADQLEVAVVINMTGTPDELAVRPAQQRDANIAVHCPASASHSTPLGFLRRRRCRLSVERLYRSIVDVIVGGIDPAERDHRTRADLVLAQIEDQLHPSAAGIERR